MPKFLIVRFSSIGDIVLTTPVIRSLKQQVPGAEVHFITKKEFEPIIKLNPYLDKIFYLEDRLSAIIPNLKAEKYDAVIDLHNNQRSLFLKLKLGVNSYSFNKLNIEKWLLVNFRIDRLPRIHIVDRYLETVKSFGVNNDGKGLDYFITEEDEKIINSLPPQHKSGYIALMIGAKHATKRLPVEKIISICKDVRLPLVLLGGPDDVETARKITASLNDKVYSVCGATSINQSAAIVKHAYKVITHDTGIMHIAAAFQKNIISIWGNTIPEFGMYPYYGQQNKTQAFIAEVKNLSCRPCSKIGFEKCPKGHFRCMHEIDVHQIIKAAE